MSTATPDTRIRVRRDASRARAELVVGKLAPRLISRGPDRVHVGVTAAEMILLDGDQVHLEVEVGPACTLHMEDIGGMVAYPRRRPEEPGPPAEWHVSLRLAAGARLVWEGLPFVVAQSADVLRRTEVQLGEGARALVRETLVWGRARETGGRLRSTTHAYDEGGDLLYENLAADAAAPEPGVLGEHRVMDSLIALGFEPKTQAGDLVLAAPGAVARHLGAETHTSPLSARLDEWRERLTASPG
ncbi:urease accessory protein UreD [Nesterenkonia populi]